jgi:hypothetical protein
MCEKEVDELFEYLEGAMRKASALKSDTLKYILCMAVIEATECLQQDLRQSSLGA